jgi:hypothetical protein
MKVNRDNDPDLSDLNFKKKTALDLWNDLHDEVFIANAYIKMTKSGSAPVNLYYDKLMKAREALKHFETTKHRVIVDALIASMQELEKQHNGTHIIRFARRHALRSRIEATKAALLVVVNTVPPTGAKVVNPKTEAHADRIEAKD